MKSALLGGILLLTTWGGLTRIHDRNAAVQRAAAAYARQDFTTAAAAYKEAAVALGSRDEAVWLNLAHATLQAGRPAEARAYYGRLLTSKAPAVRSAALQQLAVLATRKGDYAQAITLLRQALLATPASNNARYNYEALRDFLARRAQNPQIPPPGTDGTPPPGPSETEPQAGARAGTEQQGQLNDPTQRQDPRSAPQSRADATGQRDPKQPSGTPGSAAAGGFRPGSGEQRQVARGSQPGSVRGLSDAETGPEAPGGTSRRGGTETAAPDEASMQTQRARLQEMNLSSGQARQILESLGAAEQQYLQQLPRKSAKPAEKGKPQW